MLCRWFGRKKGYKGEVGFLPVGGKSGNMFVLPHAYQLNNVILGMPITFTILAP